MRTVFPILFYTWLVVSLVILVRRRMRRRAEQQRNPDVAATSGPRSVDDTQAAILARLAHEAAPTSVEPQPAMALDAHETEPGSGREIARPSVQSPGQNEAEPSAAAPPPNFRTLAELVQGIALPCNLTPHFGDGPMLTDRAAFVSVTHSANAVEQELQGELSRIGLSTIEPTNTGFVARGDRGAVEVRVHPSAAMASATGSTTFETARPEAVAVEFTTR